MSALPPHNLTRATSGLVNTRASFYSYALLCSGTWWKPESRVLVVIRLEIQKVKRHVDIEVGHCLAAVIYHRFANNSL